MHLKAIQRSLSSKLTHIALLLGCGVSLVTIHPASANFLMPRFAPPGQQKIMIDTRAALYSNVTSNDGTNQTQMTQESLSVSVPIFQNESDAWALTTNERWMTFDTNAILPSSGTTIPAVFSEYQLGVNYSHQNEDRKAWGGNFSAGSPSDRPFSGTNVLAVNFTGYYNLPSPPKSSWMFLLNYSNNRPFLNNIPLPGVAYGYNPGPQLRLLIGLPFAMMNWQPFERTTIDIFTLIPWRTRAEISYRLFGPFQLFTTFQYQQQVFLRSDRSDSDSRFYYDEKSISAGLRFPLAKMLLGSFEGGYAFDRFAFEGQRYSQPINGSASLGSAWFGGLSVKGFF